MATVADLKTQLEAALLALSPAFVALASGTLEQQRVQRSEYRAAVRVTASETATAGSNLTISIATVEVDLIHRAAGSTPAELAAAEDALALVVGQVAADSLWRGLAAVRPSPLEVVVERDVERIGEIIRYTVRGETALEA